MPNGFRSTTFTFNQAYATRRPDNGLIFHSDRGRQYVSFSFQKLRQDRMGRVNAQDARERPSIVSTSTTILAAVRERQRQGGKDLLRAGGGFVCCDESGKLRNPHTLYTEYKKLLRKLDLPDIRFHDLRHSYATAMIEQKIPLKTVSHMLGHSNISTTADIYCDVINSHQEGARARRRASILRGKVLAKMLASPKKRKSEEREKAHNRDG
jgi:hypothetical protein